ncbi:hypothetical protein QUF74_10330 [Candidatus Halobeggiatoa sp. HSG11]|nr:hypothetical protein [Candidatus Halobeggiatoa sp. HSG11]
MHKNPWLENSANNIIPLSKADDFKNALKEWEFTGNVIDHEEPTEICELCEHEELRYHYEIENIHNENHLWVGSSCILRFDDIIIYDFEGIQLVDKTERKRELDKALKEKQIDLVLKSLRKLWQKDKEYRKYIEKNVEHLEQKNAFLPKGLAIMCARMKTYKIEFKYSMFPVYLRTDESKEQLYDLEPNLLQHVIKCMSSEQRKNFIDIE